MAAWLICLNLLLISFPLIHCNNVEKIKISKNKNTLNQTVFSIPIISSNKSGITSPKYTSFLIGVSSTPKPKTLLDPVELELIDEREATTNVTNSTTNNLHDDTFPYQYFPKVLNLSKTLSQSESPLENMEETFTYIVKRQNKHQILANQDVIKKSDLLLHLLRLSSPLENTIEDKNVKDEASKKISELESKVETLLTRLSELETNANYTQTISNESMHILKEQIGTINENNRANENSTKEFRIAFATHKSRLEGQIHTLNMHLKNLNNSTLEKVQNVSTAIKGLHLSLENISHDVKNEQMKIRFNQKALTTLDKTVQANNEKIIDLEGSVGLNWVEQTTGCGGILNGNAGILSYKFRQPYQNNERCIWTLNVNRKQRITLQMLEDGFQNTTNSDFVTITEFTEEMSLVTSSRIEHGNRVVHNFKGPLVFVSFFSDSSIPGNGFTLRFKGVGNSSTPDNVNAIRYHHVHLKERSGQFTYPEDKNHLYQPNEIATFTINPPGATSLRAGIRFTDLEKEENCEYDSVNFYRSVKASYALAKKYCDQQKNFDGEILQSNDGNFIIVFNSDGSTQFKGFLFAWETP